MASYVILNSERRRRDLIEQIKRIVIQREMPIFEITIKKYKKNRTARQNALYWVWVEILADEQGCSKEEMSLILRGEFLGYDTVMVKGKAYLVPISTSTRDVNQFSRYLDEIYAFATQWGIKLPVPQDHNFIMGYDKETGEVHER